MANLDSGHTVIRIAGEEEEDLMKSFASYKAGAIKLLPEGWYFPAAFEKFANKIYNFKFKPNDVVIITYPKCGTTWMQEIVWTMRNNRNLDNPDMENALYERSPYLDFDMLIYRHKADNPTEEGNGSIKPQDAVMIQRAECLAEPRTIKVHLPFSLLPPDLLDTCKVIFVTRNPKDVCNSYYHHHRIDRVIEYFGEFDQFVDYFVKDKLVYSPYWTFNREAWQRRNHKNLFFCYYEEMKADPNKNIHELDKFLGTELSEAEIDKIVDFTSFESMKTRDVFKMEDEDLDKKLILKRVEKEGGFFKQGKAVAWKGKLTSDQEEKINAWSRKNLRDGFDSDFLYWDWF